MIEEKKIAEQTNKQKQALKQDFLNQIKTKETLKKYEKLFEQNFEKQLLVIFFYYTLIISLYLKKSLMKS